MDRPIITCLLIATSTLVPAQSGTVDPTFAPGTGPDVVGLISKMVVLSDGKILFAGSFLTFDGHTVNGLVRLNADGSYDPTFNAGGSGVQGGRCSTLAVDAQQGIYIGGTFTSYNGTARGGVARLLPDGSLDAAFTSSPGTSGTTPSVDGLQILPDGRLFITGLFDAYNGTNRKGIARLNANGSLDGTFNPGTGIVNTTGNPAYTYTTAYDAVYDRLYVGGDFNQVNGTTANKMACFNSSGALASGFSTGTGFDYAIHKIIVRSDHTLLVGGEFSQYNGQLLVGTAFLASLVKLDLNGGIIPTPYTPIPSQGTNWIFDVVEHPDGRIFAAGPFNLSGSTKWMVRQLNSDFSGGYFGASSSSQVAGYALAVDGLGRLLVCGQFDPYPGTSYRRFVRLFTANPPNSIRVMLEGPFNTNTFNMNDALRVLPSFPPSEPFTAMGYTGPGFASGAMIAPSVITTAGSNAIVDWVIVEMRSGSPASTVATTRIGLLQRGGQVVGLDGVSRIDFAGLPAGSFSIAVRPRNHLPVMLASPVAVNANGNFIAVDFTLPTTQVYDNDAVKNVGGVMVLVAGDVTFDGAVRYTGSGNDRDPIILRVGGTTPNNTVSGYWREDVNMDGVVKYTGSANDRDIILTNVGSTTPNNSRVATLP